MSPLSGSGPDPRLSPPPPEPPMAESLRPAVAAAPRGAPAALWAVAFVAIGAMVFLFLSSRRETSSLAAQGVATPPGREAPASAAAPPPQVLPEGAVPVAQGPMYAVPAPQFTTNNAVPILPGPPAMAAMGPATLPAAPANPGDRRRAPAVVVDLGAGGTILPATAVAAPALAAAGAPGMGGAGEDDAKAAGLSSDEQFAERIAGASAPERARATSLRNLDAVIPQGALISAVLETAINSDLPGFARAVVSRDVKSFDGTRVLIPRGSRLIGQYKSGVALGASRVFVIWTRVLRPDGVSVQIASPGADSLGRAGMGGEVDRHFFTRFGGSILLSVLNAGVAAATRGDTASVYIGSSADASNVAAAAFNKDGGTSPTIRTPQGAAVRVFVARDLDFSGVR